MKYDLQTLFDAPGAIFSENVMRDRMISYATSCAHKVIKARPRPCQLIYRPLHCTVSSNYREAKAINPIRVFGDPDTEYKYIWRSTPKHTCNTVIRVNMCDQECSLGYAYNKD